MEQIAKQPVKQAYTLLKIVFVAVPIISGIDKFFDFFVDWGQYLNPALGPYGAEIVLISGVIEIIAGIGMIFKPKVFSYIIAVWLAFVVLNLLFVEDYYDIALRDFGLCLSAFAMARLTKVCS